MSLGLREALLSQIYGQLSDLPPTKGTCTRWSVLGKGKLQLKSNLSDKALGFEFCMISLKI